MSDFHIKIQALSERIKKQKDMIKTEEACKNAFVMPFLTILNYNVFDPEEVTPELVADVGLKKGEKVDYAIRLNNKTIMLFECKPCSSDLAHVHMSQLYRYFSVTEARFGVLTNGIEYWFYSDLEEKNRMDQRPFFKFDLLNYHAHHLDELNKFAKDLFDLDRILTTAKSLKYTSAIQQEIIREFETPSEEIAKIFISRVYEGIVTKSIKEEFTPIVSAAFKETIRFLVNKRLSNALEMSKNNVESNTSEDISQTNVDGAIQTADIVTTDEEVEGFQIVKAILRDLVSVRRIHIRDAKTYCAILLDDNNRKPVLRLHFNGKKKFIGVFKNKTEEKILIGEIDDIFCHADKIRSTINEYEQTNYSRTIENPN